MTGVQTCALPISTSRGEKALCNDIVTNHQSNAIVVGRCLKYLIYYDDEIAGTFWLGSGFKPTPKVILNHFRKSQKGFDKMFNQVADNKRFFMKIEVENLRIQILKNIRLRAKQDWFENYSDELLGIIVTISDNENGDVYIADNWEEIGFTAGLPKDKKNISMKWDSKEDISKGYIKPTGENKKKILITNDLGKDYICKLTKNLQSSIFAFVKGK